MKRKKSIIKQEKTLILQGFRKYIFQFRDDCVDGDDTFYT